MVALNPHHRTRTPRSIEEVMDDVQARVPHLTNQMFLDRNWVWYCGPSLAGAENKATREALKEIGFRFSREGHLMPDGVTTGTWGHSCLKPKPMFPRRHASRRDAADDDAENPLTTLFAGL